MTSKLRIELSDSLVPPSAEYTLLLAFYFGDSSTKHSDPGVVATRLAPIDRDELYECWWVTGDVEHSSNGVIRIMESEDFTVTIFDEAEEESDDHVEFSHRAYRELLQVVEAAKHSKLLKIWNYIGGINDGEDDDERYRQFSAGRAAAFDEAGIEDEQVPTGTGVGTTHSHGLTIIALSSKHDLTLAENPRQVSAFHYPRKYGPRSPKFARAGSLDVAGHRLCLLSGTASIVGHESLHLGDTKAQLEETLRNLAALCDQISSGHPDTPPLVLGERSVLRVYLRDPHDFAYVASQLEEALAPNEYQVVLLQGNICRPELSIEIDGIQFQ